MIPPAVTTPNTIVLKGRPRYEEGRASVAVMPGMQISVAADGTVKPHDVTAGPSECCFAIEDALQGKTITDVYAIGDLVRYVVCKGDEEIYAILPIAAAAVTPADFLTSNGAGLLKKIAAGTDFNVAKPRESVDNSAGGTTARIRVRILKG